MKFIICLILNIFFAYSAMASTVKIIMEGKQKYGYDQPRYYISEENGLEKTTLVIEALAPDNNFPFSSAWQGSIFYKIFDDIEEKTQVRVRIQNSSNYEKQAAVYERGEDREHNALWATYYKEYPYSNNKYLYPAFFLNNMHIIFSATNKLNIEKKEDLLKYKGVHVSSEMVSELVKKEMASLKIKEVESFQEAFEEILTGRADYIVAGYYQSLIESYKLGIRDYIVYSKNPLWKMPMFFRITPRLSRRPQMENFSNYLKSRKYREKRDKAFEELVEIYRKSTQGVVPPTYINSVAVENNTVENKEDKKKTNTSNEFDIFDQEE